MVDDKYKQATTKLIVLVALILGRLMMFYLLLIGLRQPVI